MAISHHFTKWFQIPLQSIYSIYSVSNAWFAHEIHSKALPNSTAAPRTHPAVCFLHSWPQGSAAAAHLKWMNFSDTMVVVFHHPDQVYCPGCSSSNRFFRVILFSLEFMMLQTIDDTDAWQYLKFRRQFWGSISSAGFPVFPKSFATHSSFLSRMVICHGTSTF